MSRYINADDIEYHEIYDGQAFVRVAYGDDIDDTPTADVREVVHGEWIDKGDSNYYCSDCDFPISKNYRDDVLNFCPNCGAIIKGVDDGCNY